MKIPKSFQLLGHTVTVRIVSKRDWAALAEESDDMDESDLGYWIPESNLIVLRRQPQSQLLHTFWHEVMHAVLFYMNNPLWTDEAFVDNASGLLAQAIHTFKR